MNKKKFGIIGKPLAHSLSPYLHTHWFKKYKLSAEYLTIEIDENDIGKVINDVRKGTFSGLNVTLPYKQKVIQHLDILINEAKETNSVNTIYLNNAGQVVGDNTDVFGLQAGYLKEINSANKKALILGAGGVSPSVIFALIKSNFSQIFLTNRTFEKSVFLKKKFPIINLIKWEDFLGEVKNFDLIINATSLGLKNYKDFDNQFENPKESLIYIDTIYNPLNTKMIKYLNSKKIRTFNGLEMFIYQGQKSFYLWNKINPEIDQVLVEHLENKIG